MSKWSSAQELNELMDEHGVPTHLRSGIARYLVDHIKPGGFLSAVLKNDLEGATLRADELSFSSIREVLKFLHAEAPAGSYGSPEAVLAWCSKSA